jgi:hypothetical protein
MTTSAAVNSGLSDLAISSLINFDTDASGEDSILEISN